MRRGWGLRNAHNTTASGTAGPLEGYSYIPGSLEERRAPQHEQQQHHSQPLPEAQLRVAAHRRGNLAGRIQARLRPGDTFSGSECTWYVHDDKDRCFFRCLTNQALN